MVFEIVKSYKAPKNSIASAENAAAQESTYAFAGYNDVECHEWVYVTNAPDENSWNMAFGGMFPIED